ncbi:hypothetical protein BDW02DRAFT_199484 [Decorospora gaudefroyi]|uniref:Secreted protein n=1 Tax=Decorospora gaudefroyi TaxID=184978 RepID=A0A6A5K2U6_9PLEO|nr:hypothetical protein BDW02DRAFT_199484 [Decorospora gaudefroyi]
MAVRNRISVARILSALLLKRTALSVSASSLRNRRQFRRSSTASCSIFGVSGAVMRRNDEQMNILLYFQLSRRPCRILPPGSTVKSRQPWHCLPSLRPIRCQENRSKYSCRRCALLPVH